jgi:hypothetical protein
MTASTLTAALDLADHMRDHHGWTIWDSEATDITTLRAMHRCTIENNGPCDWEHITQHTEDDPEHTCTREPMCEQMMLHFHDQSGEVRPCEHESCWAAAGMTYDVCEGCERMYPGEVAYTDYDGRRAWA